MGPGRRRRAGAIDHARAALPLRAQAVLAQPGLSGAALKPLTAEEIAELRDLPPLVSGEGPVTVELPVRIYCNIPRLLDEVEAWRHNVGQWSTVGELDQGAVFVTLAGVRAVKSEYHYENGDCLCVLLASGEYAHFAGGDDEPALNLDVPR